VARQVRAIDYIFLRISVAARSAAFRTNSDTPVPIAAAPREIRSLCASLSFISILKRVGFSRAVPVSLIDLLICSGGYDTSPQAQTQPQRGRPPKGPSLASKYPKIFGRTYVRRMKSGPRVEGRLNSRGIAKSRHLQEIVHRRHDAGSTCAPSPWRAPSDLCG